MSLEAKVALLEVENATLKAENKELRKKLVEALRRGGGSVGAKSSRGDPEKRRNRKDEEKEEPPKSRRRDREEAEEPPKRRRDREASPARQEEAHDGLNAVLLANAQMEAYNESITNNIPPEQRLPLVAEKLKRFMANFDDKVQILDLKSGGAIIKDKNTFLKRYTCVFRESGAKLSGSCTKRFYYDAVGKPTFCLDFETHENLVTSLPGTPPDGKLGCREPRTEHLIVLYEERGGKITRMWLRPDADKLGCDTFAGEDIIAHSDAFKAFEAKIAEVKGGSAGERIFHNYLQIPTIG